ncbi:TrkH family potassium uptake protein [Thermaurantiacus sp.]
MSLQRAPIRIIPLAFLLGIGVGTLLLMLPAARASGEAAPVMVALFTATSAFCVTGLTVVDTASYWSTTGHAVILVLCQLGGLGIMTGATMLGLLVTGKSRLRDRILQRAELRSLDLGDVAGVTRLVVVLTFTVEAVLAAILAFDFWWQGGLPPGEALWNGLFHAVSAWNNAGFALEPASGGALAGNLLLMAALMFGVVLGGLGFPVLHELRQEWREPGRWSIHTQLTLLGTAILLVVGWGFVLVAEWSNPATLGGTPAASRLAQALFHSVMTRSGGFATMEMAAIRDETLAFSSALMLIGGGSASTAGGIRVTTFFLLGFVMLAEIRGHADVNVFRRRIAADLQRQALLIALLAVGAVGMAVILLAGVSELPLEHLVFDTISALATVGLSTGAARALPAEGQFVLVALMYIGRVGILTVAASVALRAGPPQYRYPEERPIIG